MSSRKLSDMISESQPQLTAFLKELVQIPTVVPPGDNYEEAMILLQERMKAIEFECRIAEPSSNLMQKYGAQSNLLKGRRLNLIATRKWDSSGPNILLNGHIDVVPSGDGWKYPPFAGTVKGRVMFGRGTADMKGAIASMVFALAALSKLEAHMHGSVTLTITVDEEIGGVTGLLYLVNEGLVKGDCCLVTDSTIESIKYGANGCLRFKITTYGKAAHSSRPWMGTNAIEKMVKIINVLTQYSDELSKVKSAIPVHPSFEVSHLRPTMSVGVITGGLKVNMVPDRCEALVDRRVIPEEDVATQAKKVIEIIGDLRKNDPDLSASVEYSYFHESYRSDPNHWGFQLLSKAYKEETGNPPFLGGALGCSDACYTAKSGIPTMLIGAARAQSHQHGKDEFVDLDDVALLSKIIAGFLKEALTDHQ